MTQKGLNRWVKTRLYLVLLSSLSMLTSTLKRLTLPFVSTYHFVDIRSRLAPSPLFQWSRRALKKLILNLVAPSSLSTKLLFWQTQVTRQSFSKSSRTQQVLSKPSLHLAWSKANPTRWLPMNSVRRVHDSLTLAPSWSLTIVVPTWWLFLSKDVAMHLKLRSLKTSCSSLPFLQESPNVRSLASRTTPEYRWSLIGKFQKSI